MPAAVELIWGQRYRDSDDQPRRVEQKIFVPWLRAEFHQLQGGRQFLMIHFRDGYFGGVDENPFLVRVTAAAYNTFRQEGEKGFYESLKPPLVQELEKRLKRPSQRQGDLFACRLPFADWNELRDYCQYHRYSIPGSISITDKPLRLFGARHQLQGHYLMAEFAGLKNVVFADGVLKAPDHAPLRLGGVHLLAQAINILPVREEGDLD